jgi:protein-disulfide isomerase
MIHIKRSYFDRYRPIVIGFFAGTIMTGIAVAALKGTGAFGFWAGSGKSIVAEMAGEKLTETKLREMLGAAVIPLDSDRYALYSRGIDEWMKERLLTKEAKGLGISRQELVFKKIWDQVRVSPGDVAEHYQKNRMLYNQPLEKIQEQLLKNLREKEYARIEQRYLAELKSKYRAKVVLEEPKYYLEALAAVPPAGVAGAPTAATAPSPSVAAPPSSKPAVPPASGKVTYSPSDLKNQPSIGPEDAPVTIIEFSDFRCGFCGRVSPTLERIIENYPDKVRRVWFHYPLGRQEEANRIAEASECAHEQGKFWEYHHKLFEKRGQFNDDQALTGLATDLGLNEKQFKNCLSEGKHTQKVKSNKALGEKWGVRGTPAFFINGISLAGARPYEEFKNAVENALNPGSVPRAAAAPQRRPEPAKFVNFAETDLAGRPSKGPEKAPVTIVEFSDFHCPFSGRGSKTIGQLVENYPEKIRWIFRHFPLSFHQGAEQTHAAAECAGEQGKFWEYHGRLFEKVGQYKTDGALAELAKELGLNEKKFSQCLKDGKYQDKVKKEIEAGQKVGVSGTPTFFINGKFLSGARPYENFSEMVDAALAEKK